jgi:hypothetical protein
MTVFVLFFGLALLDGLATRNWPLAAFWLLVALGFYLLSRRGRT